MALSRLLPLWQVTLLCVSSLAASWQALPDDTVDEYSDQYADALPTNLTACIPAVRGLSSNNFYSEHGLDQICTSECRDELTAYEKTVTDGCPRVTYTNEWGTELPTSEIASTLAFEFQRTCLKNEGQYCNVVLGNLTQNGGDECNKCLLLKLRSEAQYPYGSGPEVYSSVYPSFTSPCGFTGYPVTVTPTPVVPSSTPSPSSFAIPTPTDTSCAGKTYKIQPNDTCTSISLSQNIATFQLLLDNNLQAYCANFPTSGTLCIKNTCTVYTVKQGDTCKSVAKAHGITMVQMRTYNPWIDGGCYNFNRSVGTQICLDEPGEKYHPPSTCGEFYTVVEVDNCTSVAERFSIPRGDFSMLNPWLNEQCTNLLLGVSYCVLPVGDMSNYPGAPGYIPTISQIPWTDLPDETYTPIFDPDVSKIAPARQQTARATIPSNCTPYAKAVKGDNCVDFAKAHGITPEELYEWNAAVLGEGGEECGMMFQAETYYCIGVSG
ncbi:hypothetical protein BJX66DRAFT_345334 [Aspergillus keveii]|uniref:LysM domain-containing protein n=1 Tax=Aspergillus keveii TaxID=714993 RepID=A0ABR4FID8_9EURO